MIHSDHDTLVIGGGAAGLTLALQLADYRSVAVLRPMEDDIGASRWAQGGIAAVLAPQDNVEDHVQDTLVAGDGLCDEAAVRFTVDHGRQVIDWLVSLGVPFTPDETPDAPYPFHLTREGGHGARRIIHAADATGQALIDTLLDHARRHPRIQLISDLQAIELLGDTQGHCRGALCLDGQNQPQHLLARDTVLATGGANGLYPHTTSPAPACGEGMAMAAALGATLMNLEFQQFHPTCLYDPTGEPFLISEAIRGEGGILRDLEGRRFMPDYDPQAELAPRDIVSRAIHAEMLRAASTHVLLDVTHLDPTSLRHHFPTIHAHCLSRGYDITREAIPVVPAAHYSCGGIATDLHGASDVPHLYAIGEVSCTGLHGANRMASNSLLECLVYGHSAAKALRNSTGFSDAELIESRLIKSGKPYANTAPEEAITNALIALRNIMSDAAGIVRSDDGLAAGNDALHRLYTASETLWRDHAPTHASARLYHAIQLSKALIGAALQRRESRGLHYNRDCPHHAKGAAMASRSYLRD